MNILYEDNHIIVVVKPENMPSQGDSSGSYDLFSAIKDYIKVKYEKPGAVYLGLVHRLDRPVTGVMVFAKTSKAAGRLCDDFKIIGSNKNERGVNKKYMAIVCGKPPKHQRLECFMKKDERTGNAVLCKEGDEGANTLSSIRAWRRKTDWLYWICASHRQTSPDSLSVGERGLSHIRRPQV